MSLEAVSGRGVFREVVRVEFLRKAGLGSGIVGVEVWRTEVEYFKKGYRVSVFVVRSGRMGRRWFRRILGLDS